MILPSFLKAYPRALWLALVLGLLAADQVTKAHFSSTIALNTAVEVTAWFNLVHVLNPGAAFSFLADAGGWQRWFFIAVSVAVLLPIAIWCLLLRTEPAEHWLGAGVVAGGAGNLIDRVQTGAVVDFLDFHWNTWHWPAFNLADVYIVGCLLLWLALSFTPWPNAAKVRP